jgi:hypothetical protein
MVQYTGLTQNAVSYMHEYWEVFAMASGGLLKQWKIKPKYMGRSNV